MPLLLLTHTKEKISFEEFNMWTLPIVQGLKNKAEDSFCTFNVGHKTMTVTTEHMLVPLLCA